MPQNADYWRTRPLADKSDWATEENWLESYKHSVNHPHRQLILEELAKLGEFESLGEIGCNVGPNLVLIHEKWPLVRLYGVDPSPEAIKEAQGFVGRFARVEKGEAKSLPWNTRSIDVILADASLMYVAPEEIVQVMQEIDRIVKKNVIIVDRFDASIDGITDSHIWSRDYGIWLAAIDLKVSNKKIEKEDWPTSENWIKHGYIWVGQR